MNKIVLFLFLLLNCSPLLGRNIKKERGRREPPTPNHSFFEKYSFGLPLWGLTYCVPIKSGHIRDLPYGMNYYLYNQQPAVTDYYHYYSARIFSFFVRDTHGVECYLAGFGADVYPDGLKQYLSNRFPNYYIPDFYTPSFTFSEIQLGYSYKMHYRKYVLEPKFLLGIGRFNNFSDIYTFKEKGSNQFINYSIYDNRLSKYVLSYHLQLHLARRIFIKGSPHFKMEVGVKSEILLAPYKASVKIATDAYGQPATDNQFNYKDVFKMYSWGAFWAIYLGR